MSHLTYGVTQSAVPAGVIDLGLGHPGNDLLPLALMEQAAAHRFALGDPSFLQYGGEAGSPHFREHLAHFLERTTGVPADSDSFLITNGISQALDLICTRFTQPGDTVVVEEPTYFLALRIFADHGLRVLGVPVDADGLMTDALEELLRAGERPVLLYTIPTYQNPSGVTLSAERRQRLLELSRACGFRIVADEVYHLLSFDGAPPPPFAAWAHEPSVLALGSFSKILAPGLRLGWLQAAPEPLRHLAGSGLLDSGGGLNPFTSALVQSVLELNLLEPNVAHLKATYRLRRDVLAAALREHLPQARCVLPSGGYFFWVDLGDGVDAAALAARTAQTGVGLRSGDRFVPPQSQRHAAGAVSHLSPLQAIARLCFAYYAPAELEEGVRRLALAVRDQRAAGSGPVV